MANDFTQWISECFAADPDRDIRNLHGAPAWVELATADPPAAGRFLSDLLGWHFPPPPGAAARQVAHAFGQPVASIAAAPRATGRFPLWSVTFGVADLAAALGRARAAGGWAPPAATLLPGVGRIAPVGHAAAGHFLLAEYDRPFGLPPDS